MKSISYIIDCIHASKHVGYGQLFHVYWEKILMNVPLGNQNKKIMHNVISLVVFFHLLKHKHCICITIINVTSINHRDKLYISDSLFKVVSKIV